MLTRATLFYASLMFGCGFAMSWVGAWLGGALVAGVAVIDLIALRQRMRPDGSPPMEGERVGVRGPGQSGGMLLAMVNVPVHVIGFIGVMWALAHLVRVPGPQYQPDLPAGVTLPEYVAGVRRVMWVYLAAGSTMVLTGGGVIAVVVREQWGRLAGAAVT